MSQTTVAQADIHNQENAIPPAGKLLQMIDSLYVSQSISVAAKLGIADLLKDGAKSIDELANSIDVNAQYLYRLLRALASVGIFAEVDNCYFELTPMAKLLQSDVPGSTRAAAILAGEEWYLQSWGNLFNAIKTGVSAFENKFEMKMPDYIAQNPESGKKLRDAIICYSLMINRAVVDAYDFSSISKLVDVGGGQGTLLAVVLKANPNMTGVLFGSPSANKHIKEENNFLAQELASRCEIVSGDFLESLPSGGDAYIFKQVIHNLDDDRAIKVLQNCYRAMPTNGKLLVVDPIIPPGNEPSFTKLLDVQMMVSNSSAHIRTANEFQELFTKVGFQVANIIPTQSPCSIIEGFKSK